MNITPIGNRVLVRPEESPEKTQGGIYIPDTAKEKAQQGEIIAIGNGKDVPESGLAPGNKVLFEKYGGDEVQKDGEKHLIIQIKDILAIID